jgi:pimeloyl-ACP methyl ester carboxylesterase
MTEIQEWPCKRIDVGGVTLNVVDVGEGKPVLLVHGYPDSHTVWRNQIPELLKSGYRVIAPDTRGRGESGIPVGTANYKWSILASDLVSLLDALEIERVQLVGHDWGAIIGWQMAISYPERIEKYITLSVGHPNAYARGGLMQKLKGWYVIAMQFRGIFELSVKARNWLLLRTVANCPAESSDWIRSLERPGRLTAAVNYYRANWIEMVFTANYRNVSIPVVGVFSDGDRFLTEAQMKKSVRYCDSSFDYVRISGANHWMQLDAPERVNAILLEHLVPVDGRQ